MESKLGVGSKFEFSFYSPVSGAKGKSNFGQKVNPFAVALNKKPGMNTKLTVIDESCLENSKSSSELAHNDLKPDPSDGAASCKRFRRIIVAEDQLINLEVIKS